MSDHIDVQTEADGSSEALCLCEDWPQDYVCDYHCRVAMEAGSDE